jgi:SAM-dependent methyltransferase
MGITDTGLALMERGIQAAAIPWGHLKMCELGNQWLFLSAPHGQAWKSPAKPYFTFRGVDHTSIDLNGLDGAVPLDLRKSVLAARPDWRNHFDVVTDFGTAEHVGDVYGVFANVHDICRPGGIMVHVLPHTGHWPEHCDCFFDLNSLSTLASLNHYHIMELVTGPTFSNWTTGMQVYACLQKVTDRPFVDSLPFHQQVRTYPK